MTRRTKRIERLRRNPKSVRYEELCTVLDDLGFIRRQRGSHIHYTVGGYNITVPIRKPFLKAVYVKLALEIIDEIVEDE